MARVANLGEAPPATAEDGLSTSREHLIELLHEFDSVLVGYSGGVDSVFLAKVAVDALGPGRVLAVTGKSDSLASWMEGTAREVAARFAIPWLEVETYEGADPRYAANPNNRCYYCKTELWARLRQVADERGLRILADGSNADDIGDHRPGLTAGREHGVRSPLLEAGLTKAEIRTWSRELGLPTWSQPAAPCLASRIPYGLPVTPARLGQIEAAELALRALGFRDFRVRHHDSTARLEVHPTELNEAIRRRVEVTAAVREAGFPSVVLDLLGYRRGALNESLTAGKLVALRHPSETPADAARRVLASLGFPFAAVRAAGSGEDIAVLSIPEHRWPELLADRGSEVVGQVRATGFRYVSLDLDVVPVPA